MEVFGEMSVAKFAAKHATSRKPLQRFLEIVRSTEWPHFPGLKQTFPATDYAPTTGTLIFEIDGNKYRLVARVDFEEQIFFVQDVMTHEEYDREDF